MDMMASAHQALPGSKTWKLFLAFLHIDTLAGKFLRKIVLFKGKKSKRAAATG